MQHRRMAGLELLQKHVRQRDLAELLDRLVSLLSYMLQVGKTHSPATLLKQLAERAPHHKDKIMTIAERLKEEGRAQGIAIGIEKGRQESPERPAG